MKNETEMGVKAKAFIDSGALVPDDVIIGIIKERLAQDDCKNGFILDGVPRTVAQAEALEEMGVGIDKVVDIEVSDERIIQRLSGGRVCSAWRGELPHQRANRPSSPMCVTAAAAR